jgi:flotillin
MAHEIATPMSKTRKITMVTSNGETGAAKLTGEVLEIMTKMPEFVKSLTGVDVSKVYYISNIYKYEALTQQRKIINFVF